MKIVGGLILWGVITVIFFRWVTRSSATVGRAAVPYVRTGDPRGDEPMSENPHRPSLPLGLLLPILLPIGILAVIGAVDVRCSRRSC